MYTCILQNIQPSVSQILKNKLITMKILIFLCGCIVLQCMPGLVSSAPRQRRQLPCTHPLRISLPDLFTHCNSIPCTYGTWSSWERVSGSVTNVSRSVCSSGKSYTEQRTRVATGSGCNDPLRETQSICELQSEDYNESIIVIIVCNILSRFTDPRGVINSCIRTRWSWQ